MINCLRPSNGSSRLTLPLSPSNLYLFSTACHGMRRRSAASASRERVKAFSFKRSCCRAVSHSCGDTTGGVFIPRCVFRCSTSIFFPVAILVLLDFVKMTEIIYPEKISEFADTHRQNSRCGCRSGSHDGRACDTCWTHI